MLNFQCPSCKAQWQADAGKTVVCPNCGHAVSPSAISAAAPLSLPPLTAVTTPELADAAQAAKSKWDDDDTKRDTFSIAKDGGAAWTWMRLCIWGFIGLSVLAVLAALFVPPTRRVREAAARTQSINNLKQIVLAMQGFNDANKYLPFNGNGPAIAKNSDSGSWAFQILPFIDQAPYFNAPRTDISIAAFMCPGRARNNVVTTGASTDYMYNLCLNDQPNSATPDAASVRRTMVSVTDGTSNTIFAGHGQISQGSYSQAHIAGFADTINIGGTFGTSRGTAGNAPGGRWVAGTGPPANYARDPSGASPSNTWGGPFAQGGLMGMGDGTVRLFSYDFGHFGTYLTPANAEFPGWGPDI